MVVSIENAEHYIWGEVCDGWHLLKCDDLSVIQERVPPQAAEMLHYHERARQFFYILQGEGTMAFEDQLIVLKEEPGLEIVPTVRHQFRNQSDEEVHFPVISVPPTREDRVNIT